jgi:hypothetical protein
MSRKARKSMLTPDRVSQRLINEGWLSDSGRFNKLFHDCFSKGSVSVPLRAPDTEQYMLEHLQEFYDFMLAWENWPHQDMLEKVSIKYDALSRPLSVPQRLHIRSRKEFCTILGKSENVIKDVQAKFVLFDEETRCELKKNGFNLLPLRNLSDSALKSLAVVLPQLKQGTGNGAYYRAYPLQGVDTKFLERHFKILCYLLNGLHSIKLKKFEDLCKWLGCVVLPKDSSMIRIRTLSPRDDFIGRYHTLALPLDGFIRNPIKTENLIIVENRASFYALPPLPDCIAVEGKGCCLPALDAKWIGDRAFVKNVFYWGDIDVEGLIILAGARDKRPDIEIRSVLMDEETLNAHNKNVVCVKNRTDSSMPTALTENEQCLYRALLDAFPRCRLEQERLRQDYVIEHLHSHLKGEKNVNGESAAA